MVHVKESPLIAPMAIQIDRGSSVPITTQLEEHLTWLIATRSLRPGDRLPSIRELGAALGIHYHTVRQVYRDMEARDLVSTHQGAGTTVKGLTSLLQARPRYAGAMPAQGVLIADYNSFYLPLLRGIELGGAETHILSILAVAEDSQVKANLQMHQLITAGVRGLIVASVGQFVREELETQGPEASIPVVYCDWSADLEESIIFDAHGAGSALAQHLAEHGHRRIAFMSPAPEQPHMAALYRGLHGAAGSGLIEAVDLLPCAGFTIAAGAAAASSALKSTAPPRVIATSSDELALGVLSAARQLGVRIPDDLALVSYGAIDASAFVDPPLTTVVLPVHEMGLLAARRLAARIRGEPAQGPTVLPGHLVVRASCGHHEPGPDIEQSAQPT
jgi:DNA-binding LacI/PurR family transcriptional regulator/DNA-binding transcriptional regulator YhcF (GntR family)